MNHEDPTEEDPQLLEEEAYNPLYIPIHAKPVIIKQRNDFTGPPILFSKPLLGTLLFENTASDARDHCANERTFLSWLRLSIYMAIVSVAIAVSFHLKKAPSDFERRVSVPLGVVFWLLSLACLGSGVSNYFVTVGNYSRRAALVQSGWKTEVVFTVVAAAIVAACVLFFATEVSMSDANNT